MFAVFYAFYYFSLLSFHLEDPRKHTESSSRLERSAQQKGLVMSGR